MAWAPSNGGFVGSPGPRAPRGSMHEKGDLNCFFDQGKLGKPSEQAKAASTVTLHSMKGDQCGRGTTL